MISSQLGESYAWAAPKLKSYITVLKLAQSHVFCILPVIVLVVFGTNHDLRLDRSTRD